MVSKCPTLDPPDKLEKTRNGKERQDKATPGNAKEYVKNTIGEAFRRVGSI